MRILHLSTSDLGGGAARAAFRLHRGLNQLGLSSQLLVQYKESDDSSTAVSSTLVSKAVSRLRLRQYLDLLLLKRYKLSTPGNFSPQWLPENITEQTRALAPDLINLHWIGFGFMRLESLQRLNRPLVWTMHDMWAFTGGCHYSQECNRYQQSCGSCPLLNSQQNQDLSNWVWQRKLNAWRNLNLTLVAPSQWLANCAAKSSLFIDRQIEIIPNGLDISIYKPVDRALARYLLNLPSAKRLIVFGALGATSDHRKGFLLLQKTLQCLRAAEWDANTELVIFGASQPSSPPDLGFKVHYMGHLKDDVSLSLTYAAADVFVAPSTQDNLPNTVMEALACGTPVVAFKIGGMPDMVNHIQNGYLAQPFEVRDLAQGIQWVLEDPERHHTLSQQARISAQERFGLEVQAESYRNLYAEILERTLH